MVVTAVTVIAVVVVVVKKSSFVRKCIWKCWTEVQRWGYHYLSEATLICLQVCVCTRTCICMCASVQVMISCNVRQVRQ